jgi:hypothetical protein
MDETHEATAKQEVNMSTEFIVDKKEFAPVIIQMPEALRQQIEAQIDNKRAVFALVLDSGGIVHLLCGKSGKTNSDDQLSPVPTSWNPTDPNQSKFPDQAKLCPMGNQVLVVEYASQYPPDAKEGYLGFCVWIGNTLKWY